MSRCTAPELPNELWHQIIPLVTGKDRMALAKTCRKFRHMFARPTAPLWGWLVLFSERQEDDISGPYVQLKARSTRCCKRSLSGLTTLLC